MLTFFHASVSLFQTGWFLESFLTQTLIIFSIRTAIVPFFRSRPNGWFALGLLGVVVLALLLPISPLAPLFSFVSPPKLFYVVLILILVCYFMLVEGLKRWFYARWMCEYDILHPWSYLTEILKKLWKADISKSVRTGSLCSAWKL